MAKNLIFLADGTGNDSDIAAATNVYKLYQRLRSDVPGHTRMLPSEIDRLFQHVEVEQITQYAAGVGSQKLDLVGKATGKGISKNVKDGYEFFCRFYEPGDRIYLFGFSRGAYTVRSLGGLIGLCGIPARFQGEDGDLRRDEKLRLDLVNEAYRIYRLQPGPAGAALRKTEAAKFMAIYGPKVPQPANDRAPYMIGVWDTVRSLGLPTHWGDIELPGQSHLFHDHELNPNVRYAFHALAIDDVRSQFYPTIWNEPTLAQQGEGLGQGQTFTQVWFPGVHADVGGGYDDSSLSDITLTWMIAQMINAAKPPLFYGAFAQNPIAGLSPNPKAKAHDSRDTFWKKTVYAYQMRDVVRGKQESGKRTIAMLTPPQLAILNLCIEERFVEFDRTGVADIPLVFGKHSDAVFLWGQIKKKIDPRGKFASIS